MSSNDMLALAERLAGSLGPFNFVSREERDMVVSALRSASAVGRSGASRVLPDWMASLTMQQQSVLVLGLRGPDGVRKHHPCKDMVRFYRGTVLKAARYGRVLRADEAADTFMCMDGFADEDHFRAKMKGYFSVIDELPHHYHMHLMHGAQILGYKHPEELYRKRWMSFYEACLDDSHTPQGETEAQMDERLGDWGREEWDTDAILSLHPVGKESVQTRFAESGNCGTRESLTKSGGVPAAYGIIDPDYARIFTMARCIAWSYGYALLFHGSFTRDLDLIAVPWTKEAAEPEQLVRLIVADADLNNLHEEGTPKEHGRLAWTFTFKKFGDPRFIDFSVMPRLEASK